MKFVLLFAICLVPLAAQDAEHPVTKPQGGSAATAQEKKNLQLVTEWWVQVIQGHHVDLYDKYQPEDFIEHSPNFGSGKAAFVKGMSAQPPVSPMPKKLKPAPVVTDLAERGTGAGRFVKEVSVQHVRRGAGAERQDRRTLG
jgi:hypothetical protein